MSNMPLPPRIPILLVEDEVFMRTVMEASLKEAGYSVFTAMNGREALERYKQKYFPIILTDMVMPEMDGLELCRAIREIPSDKYTYIILITAHDSKEELIRGLESGADEYLVKPIQPAELTVRLKTARRILDLESRLKQNIVEVKEMSIRDPLTGTYNRGHLMQKLHEEISRASRYGHALSVIMLDIDYFKKVNDTYGHHAGDLVLKSFVTTINGSVRKEVDWTARYGGEEFVLVLPETDMDGCKVVAERLRRLVETTPVASEDGDIRITSSFGTVSVILSPDFGSCEGLAEKLVNKADECLYKAKQSGRNRVVASEF